MTKIEVLPYDPKWLEQYKIQEEIYTELLGELPAVIEHVGSTAIEGVSAKPIIDIDIVNLGNNNVFEKIKARLESAGYMHIGDLGIEGRDVFKRVDDDANHSIDSGLEFAYNLYVCDNDGLALLNHLTFRDYLIDNPDVALEYSNLKMELAEKYADDIDNYTEAKTAFVVSVLELAGISVEKTNAIARQNTEYQENRQV